jgi:hypothetical protein
VRQQAPSRGKYKGKLPSRAAEFLQYLLGFSVSVGIGLAPYLGKLDVPGFSPTLSLIPNSVQNLAVPLSTAAMGIVTVWVQRRGATAVGEVRVATWFRRTLLVCSSMLVLLVAVEMFVVVRIDVPAVNRTVSFAVGPVHPHTPPCERLGKSECIKQKLSLDESHIDAYFGETQVNCAKFVLVFIYVGFMSSFGVLVGVAMIDRTKIVSRRSAIKAKK